MKHIASVVLAAAAATILTGIVVVGVSPLFSQSFCPKGTVRGPKGGCVTTNPASQQAREGEFCGDPVTGRGAKPCQAGLVCTKQGLRDAYCRKIVYNPRKSGLGEACGTVGNQVTECEVGLECPLSGRCAKKIEVKTYKQLGKVQERGQICGIISSTEMADCKEGLQCDHKRTRRCLAQLVRKAGESCAFEKDALVSCQHGLECNARTRRCENRCRLAAEAEFAKGNSMCARKAAAKRPACDKAIKDNLNRALARCPQ